MLFRGRDYEAGRTVALIHVFCIYYNELVLIYVLYKSDVIILGSIEMYGFVNETLGF